MTENLLHYDKNWKFDENSLSRLDHRQMTLFLIIASRVSKEKKERVILDFHQLAHIFPYLDEPTLFSLKIVKAYNNLINLIVSFDDDIHIIEAHLFVKYKINWEKGLVSISSFSETRSLLERLIHNRTTDFDLWTSGQLKGRSTRILFLYIKQNKKNHFVDITFHDLKKLLNVSSYIPWYKLNLGIMQPIARELSPFFKKLKFSPKRHGGLSKKSNKIDHYHISWNKESQPEKVKKQ